MTSHWKFTKRAMPTESIRASTSCSFEPRPIEPITIRLRSNESDANGDVKEEHFTINMTASEAREIVTHLQSYIERLEA